MSGLPPPNILTYEGQVAVPFINRTFDPTTSNYQFNVPTIWVNTAAERGFILLGKPMNVADWFPFSGGSVTVESLQGNSGGPVPPTGNIINVVGDGTTVTTVGNPGTSTLTIQAAGGLATTYDGNSGSASPSGGALNILAASPNAGSSPSSTSASGNTVTVNVQKAQSIASTDATKIGLAAFNSADFSVDANGFVSATGAVALQFTGNTGTATPSSGNINIFGSSTAPGTSPVTTAASGSTVTVDVQKSQAIASTNATNVGLAAFASSNFSVDSNGFVDIANNYNMFLPTVFGGTTSGTTTYTVQTGGYTHIGNLVFVQVSLAWSNATGTGDLTIGNMPYTIEGGITREALGTVFTTGVTFPTNVTYLISRGVDATKNTVICGMGSGIGEVNLQIPASCTGLSITMVYFSSGPF